MSLATYLSQDRLRALARGESLPDRTTGSALFADISGFTQLTEALRESLGPRRGAEELTKHLEAVYTTLIAEIEKYSGSVIGFAGDAILCWFDHRGWQRADGRWQTLDRASPSAALAIACAFALQEGMRAFGAIALLDGTTTALRLKVAIATGTARRMAIGDPNIQLLDVLAGATIARTALAEHLANKDEVLVDPATALALGETLIVNEWRSDTESGEQFAVAGGYSENVLPLPQSATPTLSVEQLHPWILKAVYKRESSGQNTFVTECRPCVALFVRFVGIDYEADTAHAQLNTFICQTQMIAARYDGTVIQLTIGDKGSYLYINLGALGTYEDDARRAVNIALELREAAQKLDFFAPMQMGITQGAMRVGAYGSPTRRTYSALGDEVNLAARLMQTAAPGEILVSGRVQKAVAKEHAFDTGRALRVKGKTNPVSVFVLGGKRHFQAIRLQEPHYDLPMVGRQTELRVILEKLDLTLQGESQLIAIVAEAGMGKSRLVSKVIHAAGERGVIAYGGACQSDGVTTPYLAWKPIWSTFFNLALGAPASEQILALEREIQARAPDRVHALPLLGHLINLDAPDNEFTKSLEPKARKGVLHALLEDCMKVAAQTDPLLIVLEDMHWVDALSYDLLQELALALQEYRVCFVLAYRPPQLTRLLVLQLEALPHFTKIELGELDAAESEQVIRAKLAQLFPEPGEQGSAVPPELVEKLAARAQGNPFYLEELLNYMRDSGIDPRDPTGLEKIELPDSLHTLILSRIDQLTEREKTTLRAASIVGRLFRVAWLIGYFPALGELQQVKNDLDELHALEITPLDMSEPELAYLFKHIVTHQVTYESLPFATRAQLHEHLAVYLETIGASLETIAQHYGQTQNHAKQREYFQKAGDAAQAEYANDAALDYYGRLLPLLAEPQERLNLLLVRGNLLILIGQWGEAEADFRAALALAELLQDPFARVRCQRAFGILAQRQGRYQDAYHWAEQALAGADTLSDSTLQAQTALDLGNVNWLLGDYARAKEEVSRARVLATAQGDLKTTGDALRRLASLAGRRLEYDAARAFYDEAIASTKPLGDKPLLANILNDYGVFLRDERGEYKPAQECFTEQLELSRATGDKLRMAYALINMGLVAEARGLLAQSKSQYEQSLALVRTLGAKRETADALCYLSLILFDQGDVSTAQDMQVQAAALYQQVGFKWGIAATAADLGVYALATNNLSAAQSHFSTSHALFQELEIPMTLAWLNGHRAVLYALQGDAILARRIGAEALAVVQQSGNATSIASMLCDVGFIDCHLQEYGRALQNYTHGLKLLWSTEYRGFDWARMWAGLARAQLGQAATETRGVQFAGVAEQILKQMGARLWQIEREPLENALSSARAVMGDEVFDAAFSRGQVLMIQAQVENAFKETND